MCLSTSTNPARWCIPRYNFFFLLLSRVLSIMKLSAFSYLPSKLQRTVRWSWPVVPARPLLPLAVLSGWPPAPGASWTSRGSTFWPHTHRLWVKAKTHRPADTGSVHNKKTCFGWVDGGGGGGIALHRLTEKHNFVWLYLNIHVLCCHRKSSFSVIPRQSRLHNVYWT